MKKRQRPGRPVEFSANRERRLDRMLEQWERRRKLEDGQSFRWNSGPERRPILNSSGSDLPTGSVLSASEAYQFSSQEDLAKTDLVLVGSTPGSTTVDDFTQVITLEPIADGAVGLCGTVGICFARVDIQTDGDDFATVADGSTDLESNGESTSPFRIIQAISAGTGVKSCIIRFNVNEPTLRIGKTRRDDYGGELWNGFPLERRRNRGHWRKRCYGKA